MKPSWRRRFAEHEQTLRACAPDVRLRLTEALDNAEATGMLRVPKGAGMTAEIGIRIVFRDGSPFKLPDAFITDGTFRPENDRHIGPDGWLCLWLPQTAPAYFSQPSGLVNFIEDLRAFLLLQFMYDDRKVRGITPYWPGQQWDHGPAGHREWVREQVNDVDPETLRRLIAGMGRQRRARSPCPCGSRRPYQSCHRDWLCRLRTVVNRVPEAANELRHLIDVAAQPTAIVPRPEANVLDLKRTAPS